MRGLDHFVDELKGRIKMNGCQHKETKVKFQGLPDKTRVRYEECQDCGDVKVDNFDFMTDPMYDVERKIYVPAASL